MTLFVEDETEQTREDDITLVYQTQAALAMLAELLARDRNARLPERQMVYLTIIEHEITKRSPSLRKH